MSMSLKDQRLYVNNLPRAKKTMIKKHCRMCQQKGMGFMDIVKSVGGVFKKAGVFLAPIVLKEVLLPLLRSQVKKKIEGKGATLPGGSLKLPGQGKKQTPWLTHVKATKTKNPTISFKCVLKLASATYKK